MLEGKLVVEVDPVGDSLRRDGFSTVYPGIRVESVILMTVLQVGRDFLAESRPEASPVSISQR